MFTINWMDMAYLGLLFVTGALLSVICTIAVIYLTERIFEFENLYYGICFVLTGCIFFGAAYLPSLIIHQTDEVLRRFMLVSAIFAMIGIGFWVKGVYFCAKKRLGSKWCLVA